MLGSLTSLDLLFSQFILELYTQVPYSHQLLVYNELISITVFSKQNGALFSVVCFLNALAVSGIFLTC